MKTRSMKAWHRIVAKRAKQIKHAKEARRKHNIQQNN